MKRIAPGFFSPTAIGGVLGGLGSVFGSKQKFIDNSPVQQQMQANQIKSQQAEQANVREQQASQQHLKSQSDAARQRVDALDRIIRTFQQNLRV